MNVASSFPTAVRGITCPCCGRQIRIDPPITVGDREALDRFVRAVHQTWRDIHDALGRCNHREEAIECPSS